MEEIKKSYLDHNTNISLYSNRNNYDNSQENINLVHENLDNILGDETMAKDFMVKDFIPKIMSHKKIIKEILTFDLLNYIPSSHINSFEEFIEICINTLKKYQYKVGGYNIEDNGWILCHQNNHRFKIKENQTILYNSVEKKHCDRELIWFLEAVLGHTQRYADSDNYKIKYTMVEDEKNCICWIIFSFTDKTKKE